MTDPVAATRMEPAVNVDAIRADARELLARCSGYRFDLEEQHGGWRVHYAVDADVLVTYISASENLRHGMLFSASKQQAEIVVRMLTEFVVRNLVSGARQQPGLGQLLVISPHDEEVQRYLIRLQSGIYAQTRPKPRDARKLLRLVRSNVSNEELADVLIKNAPRLLHILTGPEGPLKAIKRFSDITAGRLINILRYQEPCADGTIYTFPTPPQSYRDKDYESFIRSCEEWKSELAKHQDAKTDWALRNDAVVLATLEWINRRIEADRRRLVLITGSHNILSTVASKGATHVPVQERFDAKYLRHPQAFLGDKDFFSVHNGGVPGKEFRVLEWLGLFIPKFIGEQSWEKLSVLTDRFAVHRRDKAVKAPDNTTEDVKAFVKQWSEQINTVAVKRKMDFAACHPTSQVGELVAELRQSVSPDWTVEEFSLYLEERARKKLISLYTATAMLGVLALRDEENRVRGVPALRFEEKFSKAQNICLNMQKIMFRHSPTLDLHALYRDLHEVDRHHYHAVMLHGFAYAIRGHWSATRTFCQMALEIADSPARDELRADKITGREAAYLLCVAQRRLATKERGIETARQYLQQARERETNTFRDPRFDSEALACDVSLLNLRRFGDDPVRTAGQAISLLQVKLPEIQVLLAELRADDLPSVIHWVTRQVFTNMMTLALIAEIDAPGSTADLRAALTEISELFRARKLSPDKSGNDRDQLSDVLFWAAVIVLGVPSEKPLEATALQISNVNPEKHGRDKAKVAAIIELCRRHLALPR